MSIAIGSYKNRADYLAKVEGYMKTLRANAKLSALSEQAFREKRMRGDAPYIPTPIESKLYATTSEEMADLNAQEAQAIQNVKSVLPKRDDAVVFVTKVLNPRGVIADPLSDPGARTQSTNVQLFNRYWGRFEATKLKGIKNISPSVLKRMWDEYLDLVEEDVLPKQRVIESIKSQLNRLYNRIGVVTPEMKTLEDALDNRMFSEKELDAINKALISSLSVDTIRRLLAVPAPPPPPGVAPPLGGAKVGGVSIKFPTRKMAGYTKDELNAIYTEATGGSLIGMTKDEMLDEMEKEIPKFKRNDSYDKFKSLS